VPQPKLLLEGKYEILGKIRDGGMGTIYKVRHRLLDEVRVIKVLQPHIVADAEMKQRFAEEARTATRLKHPNICTIHDFAIDDDGTAYLVMEYIDGVNLSEMLKSTGRPALSLALEITHQALLALGYLHRKDVVHRDIAPDNLMLTHDEQGRPLVKLIDLGIAKSKGRTLELTATGVFLGKLKYASPEQYGTLSPEEKIDGRSDLYGMGVVLYEMVTGERPFSGESAPELLKAHLFAPPLPFEESDPEGKVPPELRAAILKALEKKREDRFVSADEFDREILSLANRFIRQDDLENTVAMISTIRRTGQISVDSVTPSAQDRVNRQFGAQATPRPSEPDLAVLREGSSKAVRPTAGQSAAEKEATVASSRETRPAAVRPAPSAARRAAVWAAVGAFAVLAALFLWQRRAPRPVSPPLDRAAATPASAPASSQALPTAASAAAAPTPEAEPTPAPAEAEATAVPEDPNRLRQPAEAARAAALRSRQSAQAARAPDLAPALFDRAARRQKEAERLLREQDFQASQTAFEEAASDFRASETWARSHPRERPSPVESVAAIQAPAAAPPSPLPQPTQRAEPTHPAALPTAEVAKAPAASPSEPPRAVSDSDRIRELLHNYEHAQNTLDVDLYAKIYPGLAGAQRENLERAWKGLAKQQVELEIHQIEVKGAHAIVRATHKLVATPRIGSEQRDSRERVFDLEKRGDSWVIARIE
jgi:serine/threonine-protein kinase